MIPPIADQGKPLPVGFGNVSDPQPVAGVEKSRAKRDPYVWGASGRGEVRARRE
jgi:hypothetical protein